MEIIIIYNSASCGWWLVVGYEIYNTSQNSDSLTNSSSFKYHLPPSPPMYQTLEWFSHNPCMKKVDGGRFLHKARVTRNGKSQTKNLWSSPAGPVLVNRQKKLKATRQDGDINASSLILEMPHRLKMNRTG